MKKEYLTVKETSKLLSISIQTLRRWDKSGRLKAYRHPINNYRLYKKSDISKLAEKLTYEE